MNRTLWLRIPHFFRWMITDALFVSAAAAVYGSLFGAFEAAVVHDSGRVLFAMARFALGGAIAGAVMGAMAALTEPTEWLSGTPTPLRREG